MNNTVDTITAYTVGAFGVTFNVVDTVNTFTLVGSVILLIARLLVDVPKAVSKIKDWLKERKDG